MSDLKITHAGTVQTQDREGPINPTAPLGQAGAVYAASGTDTIIPPLNQVFVAIQMLEDTVFESSAGLVAENAEKYFNTEDAAHDLASGSESSIEGSGGAVVDSVTFPAGMTIYGRWTKIDLNSGKVIAYIG
tara:strand:- start:781 stop:1176 length:396 start_codon:yes stop_codon:yes gene_type:complete